MLTNTQTAAVFDADLEADDDDMLPERLLNGYELEGLVRTLARQQASAVRQVVSDGALLFEISERWAINILKNDPTIKAIDDPFSFDIALRETDVMTILVLRERNFDDEQLMRFCQRAPRHKTIFIDVSKA